MAIDYSIMGRQYCKTCKFFHAEKKQCRAGRPSTFQVMVPDKLRPNMQAAQVISFWPPIESENEWCGEHETAFGAE